MPKRRMFALTVATLLSLLAGQQYAAAQPAASPWTSAGGAYADGNGRFRIPVVAASSVQFRVWVPTQTVDSPTSSAYGTATAVVGASNTFTATQRHAH